MASCTQNIERDEPAFQGVRDSIFFQGSLNSAVLNPNGSIAVRGATQLEEVRILVSDVGSQEVVLGENAASGNTATYINQFGTIFSTNNSNASGRVSLQLNGDNTVSGTYNFVALTENDTDTVTFSRGFIFEVPIDGALDTSDGPTPEANTFTARINTIAFNPTMVNGEENGDQIVISGNTLDRFIVLRFPETITPGTFDITTDGEVTAVFTNGDGDFEAVTGSLTIIAHNTTEQRISGDFIFDTTNGFMITDGQFDVSYN
jgi:hypothetical protein